MEDPNTHHPIPTRPIKQKFRLIHLVLIMTAIVVAAAIGVITILSQPSSWEQVAAPPAPEPSRVPFEQPSSAPTTVPDIVIEADVPIGLEFPSVGFNSANLNLPAGQTEQIIPWTELDNKATGGALVPPVPDTTTIVNDTTVPGGGVIGTDAQSSATIAGHTSPYDGRAESAVFQPLMEVKEGDPAVAVTKNGRVCATVVKIDSTVRKYAQLDTNGNGVIDELDEYEINVKYRYAPPVEDVFYVVLCNRLNNGYTGPTTNLRVLVLEINQGAINAGSC